MTSSSGPSTRPRPDRLWVMDVTEHPTGDGKVYLAVVLDAFSRRVVGWSIADHIRSELVVDAVQMAIWRRRPPAGQTIAHSDHGTQYTSWAFGRRLRSAGLLGSMGSIGDCFDNSVAESFFGTLQLELLDEHRWDTRQPARPGHLRLDRNLVQPPAPALLLRDAQPRRLRDHQRGMIPTTNPSAGPGEAHTPSPPGPDAPPAPRVQQLRVRIATPLHSTHSFPSSPRTRAPKSGLLSRLLADRPEVSAQITVQEPAFGDTRGAPERSSPRSGVMPTIRW